MSSPPLLVAEVSSSSHQPTDSHTSNGFNKTVQVQVDISDDDCSLPSIEGVFSGAMNELSDDSVNRTSGTANISNKIPNVKTEKGNVISAREELMFWIKSIKEVSLSAASTSLASYKFQLPDLTELIKEWPVEHQELFRTLPMKFQWPTEDPDCSLEQHVDLCIALLKIPNEKAQFQAMQMLFSLYVELTKSLHYQSACHETLLQLMSDLTRKYRTK